jgi:S-DNA-T family DNA segregation ATPase FtsK/SpoIIIE
MAIAFISYGFSGAVDQSKLDLPWQDYLFDPSVKVHNIAGKGGAWLSEQFINLGFGYASFFFIVIFSVAALNLFGYKKIRFFKVLFFSVVWMLWTSISLGLALTDTADNQFLYVGGLYGFILSSMVTSLLGLIGAYLIVVFLLFILMIVTFRQFVPWLTKLLAKKEKPAAETEAAVEDMEPVLAAEAALKQETEEISISKIITDDDKIEANLDPDTHDDEDDFEIENTLSDKELELSIEDQIFSNLSKPAKKAVADPEMHVTKIVEEETDHDMPAMEAYDPTLTFHLINIQHLDCWMIICFSGG